MPEELADRAAALGYRALALTDHDNLCGALVFAHAARAVGLQPDHRLRADGASTATSGCT